MKKKKTLSFAVLIFVLVLAALLAPNVPAQATDGEEGAAPETTKKDVAPDARAESGAVVFGVGWFVGAPAPTTRYRLAGIEDPGSCHLYAIGGWDWEIDDEMTPANERYDPTTNSWTTLAPKPHPAANVQAALLNGRIYVPGGFGWIEYVEYYYDYLDIYDIGTDSWFAGASLPQGISGPAVESDGTYVYTFGGGSASGVPLDTVYRYDPGTDSWTTVAPMPGAKGYATAEYLNGRIYVCGGWECETSCYEYNPTTDTWAIIAPMNEGRQSPSLEAGSDGCLYAYGGGYGWYPSDSIEQWCGGPSWTMLPQTMPTPLIGMASGFLKSAQLNGEGALYGATGRDPYDVLVATNQYFENSFSDPCTPPLPMSVERITGKFVLSRKGTQLRADVHVEDEGGASLEGVKVTATIQAPGKALVTKTATTDAAGKARFTRLALKRDTWTLCVTDMVKGGFTYTGPDCKSWNY